MNSQRQTHLAGQMDHIESWCKARGDYARSGLHASYFVTAEHLLPAVTLLWGQGYFLESITGVDVEEGIMLVYHFDCQDRSERVALRLLAPHEAKEAPSIASVFSGANWHERECFDFFGVTFQGHPDLKPLLLPEDLGVHPLLKEQGRKSLHSLLPLGQLVDSKG
jgi:NADH-quinone oxidoreductase subunit C